MLNLLGRRGIAFGQPYPSPWISGLMKSVRHGQRHQVIDHLICCSLIEGRSCEKFQILARELGGIDSELAAFYGGGRDARGPDDALLRRFALDLRNGAFETCPSHESAARAILWRLTIARLREANPQYLAANGFD